MQKVIEVLERLAHPRLAGSWDNVGTLVPTFEVVRSATPANPHVVFLTNDLTDEVMTEALQQKPQLIISYHPTPFRSFKRLSTNDRTSRMVAKLLHNNIALYSPHTAIDAAVGGVNDWLIEQVIGSHPHTSAPLVPSADDPKVGEGRIANLTTPVALSTLRENLINNLNLPYVRVAAPSSPPARVQRVAFCAGSGAGVFGNSAAPSADLYITGELGHHEALSLIGDGKVAFVTEHTRCERGYLAVLAQRLAKEMGREAKFVKFVVSARDRDPFDVVLPSSGSSSTAAAAAGAKGVAEGKTGSARATAAAPSAPSAGTTGAIVAAPMNTSTTTPTPTSAAKPSPKAKGKGKGKDGGVAAATEEGKEKDEAKDEAKGRKGGKGGKGVALKGEGTSATAAAASPALSGPIVASPLDFSGSLEAPTKGPKKRVKKGDKGDKGEGGDKGGGGATTTTAAATASAAPASPAVKEDGGAQSPAPGVDGQKTKAQLKREKKRAKAAGGEGGAKAGEGAAKSESK